MKNNDKTLKENSVIQERFTAISPYLFRPMHFKLCTKSSKHTYMFHRKLQIKANILIYSYIGRGNTCYLHRCTKLQPLHIFKYGKAVRKQQKLPNEETRVTNIRELHQYSYHYKKKNGDKWSNLILVVKIYKYTDQQRKIINCWDVKRFPNSFQPGTVPHLQSSFSKQDSTKTLASMTQPGLHCI